VANHAPLTELGDGLKIIIQTSGGFGIDHFLQLAILINQPSLSKLEVEVGLLTQPSGSCLNNPIIASLTYQINSIQSASASHN
jgi:hypothetical protein